MSRKNVLALAFCVMLACAAGSAVAALNDYTAYWTFDTTLADESSNNYDFTAGTRWKSGGGVAGDCAAFSHVNETYDTRWVEINDVPKIRDMGSQWTLSTWFRPEDVDPSGNGIESIFDYYHTTSSYVTRALNITWKQWDGRVDVYGGDGVTTATIGRAYGATENDTWYHLAVVADLDGDQNSIDDVYVYLTPITAGTVGTPTVKGLSITEIAAYSGPDGNCKLAVGSKGDDFLGQQFFRTSLNSDDGYIDEMVFYNRALSQTEISQLYDLGVAGQSVPEPLTLSLLSIGAVSLIRRRQ